MVWIWYLTRVLSILETTKGQTYPKKEKQMLSNFFDDYVLLKNRFQRINKHLGLDDAGF